MLDRDGPELGAGRSYEPNQVFGRTSKSNKTSMTNPAKQIFRTRTALSVSPEDQHPSAASEP